MILAASAKSLPHAAVARLGQIWVNTKRLKLQRSDRGRHLLRQAGQWIDLVKIQDGKQ
jgi:hypothetical protein